MNKLKLLKSAMIWFGSVMGLVIAAAIFPILGTKADMYYPIDTIPDLWELVRSDGYMNVYYRQAPDYIDTEGNNFEMGSYVVVIGTGIFAEVMDRNLGATTTDVNDTGSYGYKFQQGNNYGFDGLGLPEYDKTQEVVKDNIVTTDNYFVNNKFFVGDIDWIWTGNSQYTQLWGMRASDGSSKYLKQGPCPEGYYVPDNSDLQKLNMLLSMGLGDLLNIPYAGYYGYENGELIDEGNKAMLWSSTPLTYLEFGRDTLGSGFYSNTIQSQKPRANGLPIRCFGLHEDNPLITLTLDTQGGQQVQSQILHENSSMRKLGYLPQKSGYLFDGWYLTGGQKYEFGIGFSGDTTLYARWINVEGGELIYQSGFISIMKLNDAPDYVDTEGNVFTGMSSLLVYNTVDGNGIKKILDRNLGAITDDVNDIGSYGYIFQWGNNYGFPWAETITGDMLITGLVDTSGYSWQKPYVSNKFIYYDIYNYTGMDIVDNDYISKNGGNRFLSGNDDLWLWGSQGPCPEGYHVPSMKDLLELRSLLGGNPYEYGGTVYYSINADIYHQYLKFPYAGVLNYFNTHEYTGSSLVWGVKMYGRPQCLGLYSGTESATITSTMLTAYGLPVRCFADEDENTVLLTFDSMGGQKMPGQMVPLGGTGHTQGYEPKKQGYSFAGWYKDTGCTEPYSFENDVITENTVVYAKWEGLKVSYIFMDGEDEYWTGVSNIGKKLVKPTSPAKSGFIFAGWYTDPGCTIKYNFDIELAGDIVLYAKYTEDVVEAVESLKQENSTPFIIEGTTIENTDDDLYEQVDTGNIATGVDMSETQTDSGVTKISLIYQDKTDEIAIGDESTGNQINEVEFITDSNNDLNIEGGVDVFIQQSTYSGEDILEVKQTKNTVNFSRPIAIPIPVDIETGSVKIKVKHAGDETFGVIGLTLNPEAGCISGAVLSGDDQYTGSLVEVENGYVWIFTCSASRFVAYTESSNAGDNTGNNVYYSSSKKRKQVVEEVKVTISDSAKAMYDQEQLDAYKWAYKNGITTIDDADRARLSDNLTRAELAKMMSQYIGRVLNKKAESTTPIEYQDVDNSLGDLASYIKIAYWYKIMGINGDGTPLEKFNPYGKVSRAELATVFSRVLFGDKYNKTEGNYYEDHLAILKKAGILRNANPTIEEVRGWVMLMMYRSAK